MSRQWQFWIDRGGTFTDCLGLDPKDGGLRQAKVLSCDEAPLVGIRRILGLPDDGEIPPCSIRLGTTLATNALLERQGANTVLVTTRGFAAALAIADQTRPQLFELDIPAPSVLYRETIEISDRARPDGETTETDEADDIRDALLRARNAGAQSVAIVLLNAYAAPALEQRVGAIARDVGFREVILSSEVAREIGFVGRGQTAVADAYLTPLLSSYVKWLAEELPGSRLLFMQSNGGLTAGDSFRGRNAVLSGPAGGVVGCAQVARAAGFQHAIGFDMGGTSTDVCRVSGDYERVYETEIDRIKLRVPMMAVETIAAGGGSVCRFAAGRLQVGPESAGATPGPACYGHPDATALTVTDVNLLLGRVSGDHFPFPLSTSAAQAQLERVAKQRQMDPDAVSQAFFAIANDSMAAAIREVTVAKGRDPREHCLVVFGGAGGQHACPIARQLGIRHILLSPFAGVLSAYGIGHAPLIWSDVQDAGRRVLSSESLRDLQPLRGEIESRAAALLTSQGASTSDVTFLLSLRYQGSDTEIAVPWAGDASAIRSVFTAEHRALFGFDRDTAIEIAAVRCQASGPSPSPTPNRLARTRAGTPLRTTRLFAQGEFHDAPVWRREDLPLNAPLDGPALVLDETSTLALDPGFSATHQPDGTLAIEDLAPGTSRADETAELELFQNRVMSIATQMGSTLARTAQSTNIRERLDFSCAVFSPSGELIANAPHIPVHLGAMGETVRATLSAGVHPGTVYAENDPAHGGSHLPDITVVTPVHDEDGTLLCVTASRGHHADVGGITPGSMPASSTHIDEEGVLIRHLPIVSGGAFQTDAVRAALLSARYPARAPDENIFDLQAQTAANHTGAVLLKQLAREVGRDTLWRRMEDLQRHTAEQIRQLASSLPPGKRTFASAMDDGQMVRVTIEPSSRGFVIDFAGSAPADSGNLNAPRAVVSAAVIYVLRCLLGTSVPLNAGVLRPVTLRIPKGSLLDPPPGAAVAAGNVETSQRLVDVLLAAFGRAAASQGTMNNLTFGGDSFGYYETICGGAGGTRTAPGASCVQTHMTNTRITDPEILEARFPMRVLEFSQRSGSGGAGRHPGGDGTVREFEALEAMTVTFLTERRTSVPFGLEGGAAGQPGRNLVDGRDVGGRATVQVSAGERIRIETPGGGGFGAPDAPDAVPPVAK